MKVDRKNVAHWLLLFQQLLYCTIGAVARFLQGSAGRPVIVLYGHQLSGNLKALYDEWQRSHSDEFDCHYLSLDPAYSRTLQREGVSVLRCNSITDMIRVGRCSAMITDHGLHAMSLLPRFTDIIFVDVWHGIPFKGFVPDDFRLQHRYDEVWVSSPFLKDMYEKKFGFPVEIVNPLGYARADKLFLRSTPTTSLRVQYSIPSGNRVVLYAPTWQQDDAGRELFPFGETQGSFLDALAGVCQQQSATLVVRSHLNARIEQGNFNDVVYCPMTEFPCSEDLLLETDVLICDWSSIAFDYLALNRPAIFLDVLPPFKHGFSLGPEYRFGKVVCDINALCETLGNILDDPQHYTVEQGDIHQKITAAIYGTQTDGASAERQLLRLKTLVSGTPDQ